MTFVRNLSKSEEEIEAMGAEEILRWAVDEFGGELALTCSWQKQSSVLAHMVGTLGLNVPIIELDTHLLFRETLDTRDRLVERYGLTVISPPIMSIAEQHRTEGPNLWETDPDRCCHIRKVEPLQRALKDFQGWASGVRRSQSPSRARLKKAQYSSKFDVWRIHPLADWLDEQVWDYIQEHEIPYHPLHDEGYASIGCVPCTRPIGFDEDERAGRWAQADKVECGLHDEDSDLSPLRVSPSSSSA